MSKYPSLLYKRRGVGLLHLIIVFTLFHETHTHSDHHHIHSENATVEDFTRLIKDKITAFDNRLRPVINQSKAVKVYVTFNLMNLLEVKERKQEIQLNAWVNFTWHDEIRPWNASDYGGIHLIHPRHNDIWMPHVIIANSLGKRDVFGESHSLSALFSDGTSKWYPGSIIYASCDLNLVYFPFDTQCCSINIIGAQYDSNVHFLFSKASSMADRYTENGEWEFKSHSVRYKKLKDEDESQRSLLVTFVFKRRSMYYVFDIIIPIMMMSYLSFFGFIIPPDSGERCGYSITVLIALAIYMSIASDEIPPHSHTFPIVIQYTVCLILLSGASLMMVVVLHRIEFNIIDLMVPTNHQQRFETSKTSTKTKSYAPSENSSYGLASVMDSKSKQLDDGVTPSDGTVLKLSMTNEKSIVDANTTSDPGNNTRAIQSRVMSNANPDKSKTPLWKKKCCYAVKNIFGLLKHADYQLFLIFSLMWLIISIYYLQRIFNNE